MVIFYFLSFLTPLLKLKIKGKYPHGHHEGYSILARFNFISIIIWLFYIILYIFYSDIKNLFWTIPFLYIDPIIVIGLLMIIIGFIIEFLGIQTLGMNFRI